jgi:DNA-binding NtrC family response regulator
MPDALLMPGNNRQLENDIKRLFATIGGNTITEEHLDPVIRSGEPIPTAPQEGKAPTPAPPPHKP